MVEAEQNAPLVLVVEDDELVGLTVAEVLRGQGLRVELWDDPVAALRAWVARVDEIDVLLTDVVMPGLNGRQLYQVLVELRADLPVVFMSGHTGEVFADWTERPVRLLRKPFHTNELLAAVDAALAGARRHRL